VQGLGFGGEGDIRLICRKCWKFETEDLLPLHGGWCGDTELTNVRRLRLSEAR